MQRKGTQAFIEVLKSEGVELVFGYPGGFNIDLFDAMYEQDEMELILPRHEQGLIHAADGYARSTGKTGVCLVTSGPGATNLVTGIATANYDSVPLVCFTGQVPTYSIGNDAFQEVDIVGVTRSICKHAVTVRERKDLVRIIKEAFYIARTGKPGPVVVDIPKDIQTALYEDDFEESVSIRGYKPNETVHLGQMKKAAGLLRDAQRPIFLIGGGVNISGASRELIKLLEKVQIPVVTTVMGKGAIPSNHELYIGNIGMHGSYACNMAVNECDLLFSIGTRFNERSTGKVNEFAPNAKIVHIDIEAASISRNIHVDVPVVSDAKLAIKVLTEKVQERRCQEWLDQIHKWNREHPLNKPDRAGLTPRKIIEAISEHYLDGIVVTDVGQHQMWVMQYLEMTRDTTLITSGGLGTMGFGLPAAMGAKLGNPHRKVLCVSGDGGIQMNIQEMATVMTCELPITICIFNNSFLGMVRQSQHLFYEKRYSGTCLRQRRSCQGKCGQCQGDCPPYLPDFMKLADSYGAKGIRVFEEGEIEAAFAEAEKNLTGATVIEFIMDSQDLVLPMVPGGNGIRDMVMDC